MKENKMSNFSLLDLDLITEGFTFMRKGKKKCSAFKICQGTWETILLARTECE